MAWPQTDLLDVLMLRVIAMAAALCLAVPSVPDVSGVRRARSRKTV